MPFHLEILAAVDLLELGDELQPVDDEGLADLITAEGVEKFNRTAKSFSMTERSRMEEGREMRAPKISGTRSSHSDLAGMKRYPICLKRMAGHSNIKATELYDRRGDDVSFSEIERVGI